MEKYLDSDHDRSEIDENEMQAIQGGVDTPPPCDSNPSKGYTTIADGPVEKCPTAPPVAKVFPTPKVPQY